VSTDSTFVKHLPCEACGSSDANSLFTDGHTHCFACGVTVQATGETAARKMAARGLLTDLEYRDVPKRNLTEATATLFGYGYGVDKGQRVQVANYYNAKRQIVAQKVRTANKEFWVNGNLDDALLFGQQLWQPREHVKKIVITEGEIDAMSVSQVQENKWPVVSIPTGAKGAAKALRKHLEWLEQFEQIVLMFDNDEEGIKATQACVELFTPGKVKVATLPLKDANDMLKAGRAREIVDAIWNAKAQRPDGIVAGTEMWDVLNSPIENDSIPYPYVGLNNLLHGCRRGEMVLVTGGTGTGKSEGVGMIAHDFLKKGETVGYCALEENTRRTALRFMGLEIGRRLHIDREDVSSEDFRSAYDTTVGSGRLFLYDHWGSVEGDALLQKIRYLVRGCGATTIVLDHISIAISGLEVDNERKAIDILMTNLRKLVQELNCRLILICHLRKADGTTHEEGGRITLDDLRGSGSLKQLPDIVIAMERNQQDEKTKFFALWRVLKNRFSGETGEACWTKYEIDTGRMVETMPQEFEPVNQEENKDF
jgi:twinkle protein